MGKSRRLTCAGTAADGSPCPTRVTRIGERCASCLARTAETGDVAARLDLAADPAAPGALLRVLATDVEPAVRLVIAERLDTSLVDLQRLEHDAEPSVRSAAARSLSAALTPRAFDEGEPGSLFSAEDLEALSGSTPVRLHTVDEPAERRPRHLARSPGESSGVRIEDLEDVIARLESLSDRLASLEAAICSTGEQLSTVTELLGELAEPKRVTRLRPGAPRPERGAAGG